MSSGDKWIQNGVCSVPHVFGVCCFHALKSSSQRGSWRTKKMMMFVARKHRDLDDGWHKVRGCEWMFLHRQRGLLLSEDASDTKTISKLKKKSNLNPRGKDGSSG